MKRLFYIVLPFLCLSCVRYNREYVDFATGVDYSEYLNAPNRFVPFREELSDMRDEAPWEAIELEAEQSEASASKVAPMQRTSPMTMTDVARGLLEGMLTYRVHQVAGTYRSIDVNGDSLTVSGKFFYPESGVMKNLMIVSHYTIGANHEAPSETFSFEGMFAGMGYGVIMADYIGYGVTVDSIHPYLQAETTAHNVIDMALAVRAFIAERRLKVASDEVILMGYSQGGATTLHVQRVMETDRLFSRRFKIKKVYAGAGPYDIARTYDYSVRMDETGIPCAIPLIIQGMSIGMERPLDMAYFFQEPLLSNYDEWINSKRYTVNQMSTLIGRNRLSDILTTDATNRENRETARFYAELISNSIPETFSPQAPLYMFHSEDDETVPYINSQLMRRQFRDNLAPNVTYNFGHYGTHMRGAITFMRAVAKDLKQESANK